MKLDSRIKSLSDILTCFDIERAKEFLGEKGYFASDLYCFTDLRRVCPPYGTLANVFDDPDDTFQRKEDSIYSTGGKKWQVHFEGNVVPDE